MNKLYKQQEYESAKSSNKLPFECEFCHKTFYIEKHFINSYERDGYGKFCSVLCGIHYHDQGTWIEQKCGNCEKIVRRTQSELKKNKSKIIFCSQSCAAIVNNQPRRKRCPHCQVIIRQHNRICQQCKERKRLEQAEHFLNRTLKSFLELRNDANRYSQIREHARRIMAGEPQICAICQYDLHVQVCHKKSISSFLPTDTIRTINTKENLILLCPNHHWELDHHLLKSSPGG